MRICALIVLCLLPLMAISATRTPARKSSAKSATSKSLTRKSSSKKKSSKSRKRHSNTAQSWRNRQQTPTPERYKEIQGALAAKGYLKTQPSGVWDGESLEALKRFQQDQNLESTGKLDSISLIALGLGPKRDSAPATAPNTRP